MPLTPHFAGLALTLQMGFFILHFVVTIRRRFLGPGFQLSLYPSHQPSLLSFLAAGGDVLFDAVSPSAYGAHYPAGDGDLLIHVTCPQ